MGDKIIRCVAFLFAAFLIGLFLWLAYPPNWRAYDIRDRRPGYPDPPPAKSIVVRVTPVDGEPGAYVLEYDNGYVEVVHADGTREALKLDTVENNGSQPIRSNPHED